VPTYEVCTAANCENERGDGTPKAKSSHGFKNDTVQVVICQYWGVHKWSSGVGVKNGVYILSL
jgi:hypothetical protein